MSNLELTVAVAADGRSGNLMTMYELPQVCDSGNTSYVYELVRCDSRRVSYIDKRQVPFFLIRMPDFV